MTDSALLAPPAQRPRLSELRPVTALYGVGTALAAKLANLGIHTIQDVLFHLPFRYEDRTQVTPMGDLRVGDRAVIEGKIQLTEITTRARRQLLCTLTDGTGRVTLRFFHFSSTQYAGLERGTSVRCFGEVRRGPTGLEIVHPEYQRLHAEHVTPTASSLTPIYPATEGVQQGRLRQLTTLALKELQRHGIDDWLPREVLPAFNLPSLHTALDYVHRPPPQASLPLLMQGKHPAQRRLAFEELLAQHLSLRQLRQNVQRDPGQPLQIDATLLTGFLHALPFKLTRAQQRVWQEIQTDLQQPTPMLRLVQGDVGSGKTIVAALAALQAISSQCQTAIMAPTELLAEQHAHNFTHWFAPFNIKVALLTSKHSRTARAHILADVQSGTVHIVVGTHALFQNDVLFKQLGLVIIDEQHRFGVQQRLLLREKGIANGCYPHQLIMTATPIPRTLAMTAYADLDVSIIDELPPGRTPVHTVVLHAKRRDEIVQRIREACLQQRQAYWVCPLIEESEQLIAQAAEETATTLIAALPELRVALIHGRMKPKDKEAIMLRFKQHEIDLLVATTVIEVGVDVANASLMVIENAERMGLAQLHQLRGRVGRGSARSTCVLMYQYPLSAIAKQRLHIMRTTCDGFEIAKHDLALRGPGELLGTRQTGLLQMRVADLARDADLLPHVQQVAEILLRDHPQVVAPLLARWTGHGTRFAKV